MPADLVVPPAIERVIQDFERAAAPTTALAVNQKLAEARNSLENPSEAEKLGTWAEVLAFALVPSEISASPWRTFFGPMGSGTYADGKPFYSPDIAGTDPTVVEHWSARARATGHPVLKARYADLAWDMAPAIAKRRRDVGMAYLAIDAYLACVPLAVSPDIHDRFRAALRAIGLACLVRDQKRVEIARAALLRLFEEAIKSRKGPWWLAFERLVTDRRTGLTDGERRQLVAGLEGLVEFYGDRSNPERFNPHALKDAATHLIKHYTRVKSFDEVKRLQGDIARAFEHFASLGDPMLASAVLQTAVDAYRAAGLPDESERARILMQENIVKSHDHMKTFSTKIEVSREDMDKFLAAVVVEDLGATFARIAAEFLPSRRHLEEVVQRTRKEAPLLADMPQAIMAADHVAAMVGSVEEDPFGRLLQQTTAEFKITALWLQAALDRTIEIHNVTPHHFVGWANRLDLFDDLTLLIEGVEAWYAVDLVKVVHVLVPQVERGLRSIVAKMGRPVTKAHSTVPGVSVAIGMGDILYAGDIGQALGPDLALYFQALYADPRGRNLRNRVAHGLLKPEYISLNLANLLVHTLLVFGVWEDLAKRGRPATAEAQTT